MDQPIKELSGGNQQKVLLGRWLAIEPDLLILDEPTRGVDVGAKLEIQSLIRRFVAGGGAALLISSEFEELIEGADRIVVMQEGRSLPASCAIPVSPRTCSSTPSPTRRTRRRHDRRH
jgi:galactofuranose transport system ATP-binding protein